MIDPDRFCNWLTGADLIFESLEGRYDAYNISSRWIDEWLKQKKFIVTNSEREIIAQIPQQNVYIYDKSMESKIRSEYESFINDLENNNHKLSYAFALYLMTWNIRRFEEYFKADGDFDLNLYCDDLNNGIKSLLLDNFSRLRKKHILLDEIDESLIKSSFENLNQILKESSPENYNEPIGAIKLLHIMSPYYLPLLDNPIARALKFSELCDFFQFRSDPRVGSIVKKIQSSSIREKWTIIRNIQKYMQPMIIDFKSYLQFIRWTKNLLDDYKDEILQLEKKLDKSILKLLDEALYVRYSIDILTRLK